MLDRLPPLPDSLRPPPGRIEHLPRALKIDGSGLPALPLGLCALKRQFGPGNPTYEEDRKVWMMGLVPLERACGMVCDWIESGKISGAFCHVLLALLALRCESEERKAR